MGNTHLPLGAATMVNGHERRIEQRRLDGKFIQIFDSFNTAFKALNRSYGKLIREVCQGKRAHAYGFLWRYYEPDQEDERWISHPCLPIRCSTHGRIERPNGQKTIGTRGPDGYWRIGFKPITGNKSFMVHRLIAETFHPHRDPTQVHVNHLDRNKSNNRPCNLQWATPSQNTKHYYANK